MDKRDTAFLKDVVKELAKARAKFPSSNCSVVALMEETGEVAKATLDESPTRVFDECVQVAVMVLRVATEGDVSLNSYREKQGLTPI